MFNWWGSTETQRDVPKENDETISTSATEGDKNRPNVDEEVQSTPNSELDYAKDVAKNVGSYLFSFASAATTTAYKVSESVKDTVEKKTFLGDFIKEQEKFVKEKQKRTEAAIPPWVGYNEEEAMKSQILALSSDERNFLRDPPSGVQFHFEYDLMSPVALTMLKEDEKLTEMRFELVPKRVSEENFWRNYFYRVSLIKQSTQLTSMTSSGSSASDLRLTSEKEGTPERESSQSNPQDITSKKTNTKTDEHLVEDLPDSPTQHEFVSDAFAQQEELSHEDLQQIGVQRKQLEATQVALKKDETKTETKSDESPREDVPEWEKELQEELEGFEVVNEEDNSSWEKEIEDMLEAEE